MHFDIGLLKKHPYATGAVVLVGGLVVFYMLSQQNQTGTVAATSVDSTDAATAQANAAAAVQTNAQNAAIQQTEIATQSQNYQTDEAANVSNTQTLAALAAALSGNQTSIAVTQSNNDAATLQQQNQEISNQNVEALQESGIQDQINQAYNISANNNATNLAGLQTQLADQTSIDQQALGIAGGLATQQQADQFATQSSVNQFIFGNAGVTTNSGEYGLEQSLIASSSGSSAPQSIVSSQTQGSIASAASSASIAASLSKLGSSVIGGLF